MPTVEEVEYIEDDSGVDGVFFFFFSFF